MRSRALLTLLACPLMFATTAQAEVPSAGAPVPWDRAHVLALGEKAADYQIDGLARGVQAEPVDEDHAGCRRLGTGGLLRRPGHAG